MAPLIALAAIGLFAAGAAAGIIGVTSAAIRREEKNLTLTRQATGPVIQAGRWVNGLGVRDLRSARVDRLDQHQRHLRHRPFPEVALARQAPSPRQPCTHPAGRDPDAR
jgi:hypothetical protein